MKFRRRYRSRRSGEHRDGSTGRYIAPCYPLRLFRSRLFSNCRRLTVANDGTLDSSSPIRFVREENFFRERAVFSRPADTCRCIPWKNFPNVRPGNREWNLIIGTLRGRSNLVESSGVINANDHRSPLPFEAQIRANVPSKSG